MMTKKTTIHDIAKALNTTAATVSRALNDHPKISDETKKLVKKQAKDMGYERNHVASALRKGHSNTVGVIVPFVDRGFFASIIRGVEEVLSSNGFNMLICQSRDSFEDEVKNIDTLLNAQVAGIIISVVPDSTHKNDHLQKVLDQNATLLMFDRVIDNFPCSSVLIDDYKGGYQATEHLIQQGFKKILCFHGDLRLNTYQNRLKGYKAALADHGIETDESLIIEAKINAEDGYAKLAQVFPDIQPPFGLFSTSDFTAFGAMRFLKEQNIKIPEEAAIVGFSNDPFTEFVDPPLSTIDQKSHATGKLIAETLLNQHKNKAVNKGQVQQIVLEPALKIRKSSGSYDT